MLYKDEFPVSPPETSESLFVTAYKKLFKRNEEVFEILNRLRSKNIRLALLSNMIEPHTNYLKSIGITEGFDVSIFSNEVGMRKPEPGIYPLTLEKLHLRADEAFFVDDKKRNTAAAEDAGMRSSVFSSAEQLLNDLHNLSI